MLPWSDSWLFLKRPQNAAGAQNVTLLGLVAAAMFMSIYLILKDKLNGPWNDEYATLWFSEPAESAVTLYKERWSLETNPPLYYFIVWIIRKIRDFNIPELRLVNLPFLLMSYVYALSVAWRSKEVGYYALCATALILTSGDQFVCFPELRSYSIQLSAFLAFSLSLALIGSRPQRIDRIEFAVLAACSLMLLNIHFTAALLAGLMLTFAIFQAYFAAQRKTAVVLFLILFLSAAPAAWFVLANFRMLSGQVEDFWIKTTQADAAGLVFQVIRGAFSRNLVLACLIVIVAFLRARQWLGQKLNAMILTAVDDKLHWTAVTFALAVFAFFVVLLLANAHRPIVIMRYVLAGAVPLSVAFSCIAAPALRVWPMSLLLVFANSVIVLIPQLSRPASPGDYAGTRIISELRTVCPDTRVYGVWLPGRESGYHQLGYRYIVEHLRLPMQLKEVQQSWIPERSPSCPTVIWLAHGSEQVESASAFARSLSIRINKADLQRATFWGPIGSHGGLLVLPPHE